MGLSGVATKKFHAVDDTTVGTSWVLKARSASCSRARTAGCADSRFARPHRRVALVRLHRIDLTGEEVDLADRAGLIRAGLNLLDGT
jgi:hypothetical protein